MKLIWFLFFTSEWSFVLSLTTSKISMYLPTDSQGHCMNIGTSWWRNYKSWRFYIAAEIFLFKCNVIHRLVLDFNKAICLFLFSLYIIIENRNRTFVSFWVFIWQKKKKKKRKTEIWHIIFLNFCRFHEPCDVVKIWCDNLLAWIWCPFLCSSFTLIHILLYLLLLFLIRKHINITLT